MKKFVVSLLVVMFAFVAFDVSFARQIDQGDKTKKGSLKFSFEDHRLVYESDDGDVVELEEGSQTFSIVQSKLAIAAASVLSNELANVIMDNSGNYTFFKKQGSNAGDVEDSDELTMYIKAFGGQDKLDMKDWTKFDTTYYGAIVGLDTDRKYNDNFDATYGLFVSYVGSQLKEDDFGSDKLSQDSFFGGVRGIWYIDKLFFGAVLDYGYLANKVKYDAGGVDYSKDYNIQNIGFSAKAGYNFEVEERSFTIQPHLIFNSNYLIMDEYESYDPIFVEGNKLKADNIINMAIAPGVKLAKTLGQCWILSAEGKYFFVSSNGDIKIEDDYFVGTLPETYYKDYAILGLGIEKIWGYTVLHVKVNKTFCGRDGFFINAGIEFKF